MLAEAAQTLHVRLVEGLRHLRGETGPGLAVQLHEGGALVAVGHGVRGLLGAHEGQLGGRGGVGHPIHYGRGPPGAGPRVTSQGPDRIGPCAFS